jgi:WD40 repeat protein
LHVDGQILAWDFTDSSYRPSIELKATHTIICSIEFLSNNNIFNNASATVNTKSQLLAVGTDAGTLHVFELPPNLSRPVNKEEWIMQSFIDKEVNRMDYVKEIILPPENGKK